MLVYEMIVGVRYQIRPMTEADIAQVTEVERESFPTSWPRTAYKRELSNRLARYLVLVDSSRSAETSTPEPRRFLGFIHHESEAPATRDYVVGYVGLWLLVDEAHIVAIAVREAYRRRGLGELLLAESIQVALDNHQEAMTLEVRRTNAAAQALYEKYRFLKVGVRKRYYSDNHEDAIIMTTPPIQDQAYREHLTYYRERLDRRLSEALS
jgi:ribosomal-protein-alanine N-acetyltransferase